jgi:hypothetical protein
MASGNNIEPVVVSKSIITEQKPPQQSELIRDQEMKNVCSSDVIFLRKIYLLD